MEPLKEFTFTRGDNKTLAIPTFVDGVAFDPRTADVLIFTMKKSVADKDPVAVFQKVRAGAVVAGITPNADHVLLDMLYQDTADTEDSRKYFWDLQGQNATIGVKTLAKGTAVCDGDVTRSLSTSTVVHSINPPIPGTLGDVYTASAAVDLGSGRFVNLTTDGLRYADGAQARPSHGYVREAYSKDRTAIVEKTGLLNGLAGLSPGSTYYLADSGTITATAPTTGIRQSVGVATSTTELSVTISEPVTLT